MATVAVLKQLQEGLKAAGLYTGGIDGAWGPGSHGAFVNFRRMDAATQDALVASGKVPAILAAYARAVAWSAKVPAQFATRVTEIASLLKIPDYLGADALMSCMAFETGETFSPSIKNGAGAPYYGLIQFGKDAATDVGTTLTELVKMDQLTQLEYVYKFFKPYAGKLKSIDDLYMRILYPAAVGKAESHVLFPKGTKAYLQNQGLDLDKDGAITKGEAATKIRQTLVKGLHPKNLRIAG